MVREETEQALKDLEDLEKEQEKKKQELEKLKKKINAAKKHVKEERDFEEKVPIDQVAAANSEGMTTAEKEIFDAHHGTSSKKITDNYQIETESTEKKSESLEQRAIENQDDSLEATVSSEAQSFSVPGHLPPETELALHYHEQIAELSRRPMAELYGQIKEIYDTGVAQGYVAADMAEQAVELQSAIERKLADVEAGNYQFTSDRTAKAASVSLALKDKVSAMYVANKNKDQTDLYK